MLCRLVVKNNVTKRFLFSHTTQPCTMKSSVKTTDACSSTVKCTSHHLKKTRLAFIVDCVRLSRFCSLRLVILISDTQPYYVNQLISNDIFIRQSSIEARGLSKAGYSTTQMVNLFSSSLTTFAAINVSTFPTDYPKRYRPSSQAISSTIVLLYLLVLVCQWK